MTDAGDNRPGLAEVMLDGVRLRLANNNALVQFSNLARFQPKILFGDPSKDDNDLLSSWQSDDFSGGSGVLDLKEGTDTQRYAFSTLYTRFPGNLTKPPFVANNAAGGTEGSGDKQVLGEFWDADTADFNVVWKAGSTLHKGQIKTSTPYIIDGATDYEYTGTLSLGTTINPGVAWTNVTGDEFFYIPCPNKGYYWICDPTGTGGGAINSSSSLKFSWFTVWDHKLVGITSGGRLYYAVDEDAGAPGTGFPDWQPYDLTFRLSRTYKIRGLINYFDRGDRPCIFILTDRDIWQFDPDGPEVFRLDFGWPSHPSHGLSSCVWNGELYISIGMGVFRYEGGTFVPVGLDRDNGLPGAYLGKIVQMIPGYNAMYALVQSTNKDPNADGGRSSIHEWTGSGWHCIWTDYEEEPGTNHTAFTVTGIATTQSNGFYTLVFSTAGSDDHIYTMPLSLEFANPRQAIRAGQMFGSGNYYYLDFGEFDADMGGYTKIANAWSIWLEEPIAQTPALRDDVILLYKIDREAEWQELAYIHTAAPGFYTFPFGDVIEGTEYTEGKAFKMIERRVVLKRQTTYNADKPTVITNQTFSFLKTVRGAKSFTFDVVTTNGSLDGQYNQKELEEWLDGMIESHRFIPFTVGERTYRVFLGQEAGNTGTGDTQMGQYSISVVQVHPNL